MRLRAILAPTLMVCHPLFFHPHAPPPKHQEQTLESLTPSKDRLLSSKRARLVLNARRGIRAGNVAHWLRRRPSRSYAAPHWRLQVVEDFRRRSHRRPPATRRTSAVYGARLEDGGEQRARARNGEAFLQKGGRGMEARGASTDGEMERIRV